MVHRTKCKNAKKAPNTVDISKHSISIFDDDENGDDNNNHFHHYFLEQVEETAKILWIL